MTTVRYDASDAEDEARAIEFSRLIRKLRQELEKNNELRDLTTSSASDRAGVLDLNVMIRRALAQAAPQIGPADAVAEDDTWCLQCGNTGLATNDGASFASCACLDDSVSPVTVVCLGERSLSARRPLHEILLHVPMASPYVSAADRDTLLEMQPPPAAISEQRWAAVRTDGSIGIGASPIEALLALETQFDRGGTLESIARRRDPMPEEHRTTVMEAVSREVAQLAG
tara:strand:+ start:268 stop:951 length:684 start_codon:yes stop_codon:yes gene_type:complete